MFVNCLYLYMGEKFGRFMKALPTISHLLPYLFKQLLSGDLLINSSSGEPSLFTDTPVSLGLCPH